MIYLAKKTKKMSQKEQKILNIGCGKRPIDGAVNHDRRKHADHVDVAHDLNLLPWPWGDESFDLIAARAVLEHLQIDLIDSVNECWRILRHGGILVLKLPYWKHNNSYMDPTHRWFCALETPTIFDPATEYGAKYDFYTPYKWKIIKGPRLNNARSSIHCTLEVRK